jgi:hypothetical protein
MPNPQIDSITIDTVTWTAITAPRDCHKGSSKRPGERSFHLSNGRDLPNLALPLFTHYWATAAGAFSSPSLFEVAGLVHAIPGNQIALGVTVVPTTVTVDVAMYWEEVPYLT